MTRDWTPIEDAIEAGLSKTPHGMRDDARQEAWCLVMELIRQGRRPDVAACVRQGTRQAAKARTLVPRIRLQGDRRRNGLELPVSRTE